ncbi:MAG: efflux RND transporter periplasmic adaptor subunit [Tannerella sp.]|nr:efflux RND transporter periplasmic adaptor subunit [Tannerella sp.]
MSFRICVLMTVCAVILSSCKKENNQQPSQQAAPQSYPAKTMKTDNVTIYTTYPVTIKGQEDIEIRPRIDGFIENIFIDEGSAVKKGQVLFKINSPQSEQAVMTAKASVNSAHANLNTAELDVERMRILADKNIISKVQLASYVNQYKAAQAVVAEAEATLSQAQATLSWTNVSSPVEGMAGSIPYRLGSLVSSSNVLTTIANTNNVFAYFSLNEKDLMDLLQHYEGKTQAEKIKNMPETTLTLADGTVYPEKGKIETIAGVVNTSTGSANLRVEFPNKQGTLRSGTSGRIEVSREFENVFEIPQKATFTLLDKTMVYKIQGDSVIQTVIDIESVGDGQHYVVTNGLQEGDIIVTDGIATLSNGKKIKVN